MNRRASAVVLSLVLLVGMAGCSIGVQTPPKERNQAPLPTTQAMHSPTAYAVPIVSATAVSETAPSPTSTAQPAQYEEQIEACYPPRNDCSACTSIPNDSIQQMAATERHSINLPKALYPKDITSDFFTASGNATAGYISNGGPIGEGLGASPGCWSTYFEFDGIGEVDLSVKGLMNGVPDYFVRFIIAEPGSR